MKSFGRLASGFVLATVLCSVRAEESASVLFDDSKCTDPASLVFLTGSDSACKNSECTSSGGLSGREYCTAEDRFAFASSVFGTAPYLVVQQYGEVSCTGEYTFQAISADGECHPVADISAKVTLNSDGSAALVYYSDGECKTSTSELALPKDKLAAHDCVENVKYYAYAATTTSTGTGTSAAAPLHLASTLLAAFLGGLAVVLL